MSEVNQVVTYPYHEIRPNSETEQTVDLMTAQMSVQKLQTAWLYFHSIPE